jgi:sugar lactone lactonase YvrE
LIYHSGSRTVRPVRGVPGASYIGSPVLNDVDAASIAPGGEWAFVTKNGRSSFVRGLSDTSTTESSPDGLIAAADRVVWNRDGSAALLYSSSANQLQRVRISGTDATADAALDVPAGRVTALALDPAGRQIALGIAGSGLYLFNAGDSPALISSIAQPAAAAFDETGRKLYAVDLDSLRIVQFDSGSAQSDFISIGGGIVPAGLAVSAGGRYLMLADSAARAVYVYDIASQTLANILNLDFAPSRFEPLSSGPTFLLNGGRSGEWLLVLDARQSPGITIVPALGEELQ